MKTHKLYAYDVIYDLCCNIYLCSVKGDSKSAKGSSNESSFLTRKRKKQTKKPPLTLKHTIPLQMHFLKIVVSQEKKVTLKPLLKAADPPVYRRCLRETLKRGQRPWAEAPQPPNLRSTADGAAISLQRISAPQTVIQIVPRGGKEELQWELGVNCNSAFCSLTKSVLQLLFSATRRLNGPKRLLDIQQPGQPEI